MSRKGPPLTLDGFALAWSEAGEPEPAAIASSEIEICAIEGCNLVTFVQFRLTNTQVSLCLSHFNALPVRSPSETDTADTSAVELEGDSPFTEKRIIEPYATRLDNYEAENEGGNSILISNAFLILWLLAKNPSISKRELAAFLGITDQTIKNSIVRLERAGFLTTQRRGIRNLYSIHMTATLDHPLTAHISLNELLEALPPESRAIGA